MQAKAATVALAKVGLASCERATAGKPTLRSYVSDGVPTIARSAAWLPPPPSRWSWFPHSICGTHAQRLSREQTNVVLAPRGLNDAWV